MFYLKINFKKMFYLKNHLKFFLFDCFIDYFRDLQIWISMVSDRIPGANKGDPTRQKNNR